MQYYFTTQLFNVSFNQAIDTIKKALEKEGFGIISEIDLKSTFNKKLQVEFYNYHILGACNPQYALKALTYEDKIGTMLPCNIIVQEKTKNTIEVSAINPVVSMQAVINEKLVPLAYEISEKLKRFIDSL
jgi:uncharacterized protein (DUF302 family)